jgi:hypothetical protein
MSGMLRDVNTRPDKYAWLGERKSVAPPVDDPGYEILDVLRKLRGDQNT